MGKDEIKKLEKEIEKLKNRNRRVEGDKEWETSWTRRISIALATYILLLLLMFSIGVEKPFFSSLIPAGAYLISTASLEKLRSWWIGRKKR